jgi:hypothetical protein
MTATIDGILAFWFARFGRFPHRNEALARRSTPEELEFLDTWEARRRPKAFKALVG